MEGTRNERVIILTVSYIIGLITAYIAFGVTQLETTFKYVYIPASNTAAVIAANTSAPQTEGVVAETKDGLVYIKDNATYLLSNLAPEKQAILSDGHHVAIADYSVSPDHSQVYFCEIASADLDLCRPYLYDVASDSVSPLTEDGKRIAFDTNQSVTWDETGELSY